MIIRVSGGSSGISKYLSEGRKAGRSHSRDELDQRVILHGSLDQIDAALASFDLNEEHEKYIHITLSFKEKIIDKNILHEIDNQFRKFIFSACRSDEFLYYSECHLPKIKTLLNYHGNKFDRYPHIHVVIPEFNLYTGKRDEFLGKRENILHYINSFQEMINEKYQLESPKTNKRKLSLGREEILFRYEINPDMTVKEVKEKIFALINDHPSISSVDELAAVIGSFGVAKVRDSKSFGGKYINLSLHGRKKAINLKDPVFGDAFLANRDMDVAKTFNGIDHGAELSRWKEYAALEARFAGRVGAKRRQAYADMTLPEKIAWLQDCREKHEAMLDRIQSEQQAETRAQFSLPSAATHKFQEDFISVLPVGNSITIDDIPHLHEIRNLHEVPHLHELTHLDDLNNYIDFSGKIDFIGENNDRYEWDRAPSGYSDPPGTGGFDLYGMRVWSGNEPDRPQRHDRRSSIATDLLSADKRFDVVGNGQSTSAPLHAFHLEGGVFTAAEIRQAIEAGKDSKAAKWSEIIAAIDARQLLNYVQYHYGLDDSDISIEIHGSGNDRLHVGNRRFSASDFLTKYMHLTWPEAKQVLQTVFEQQEKDILLRSRSVTSKALWQSFIRHEHRLPGLSAINKDYIKRRRAIYGETRYTYDKALTPAQNAVKSRLTRDIRNLELDRAEQEWQDKRRYYLQSPHERYIEWLHGEAVKGSTAALGELYRISPQMQEESLFEIHIREHRPPLRPFSPRDLKYTAHIRRNGTVEYKNTEQQVVILDTYHSIKVKVREEDVIANALELAKLRYGVNGFEIRNAKVQDLAAIGKAVRKAGVNVTVLAAKSAQLSENTNTHKNEKDELDK